jgi:hypothetical protein
MVDAGLSGVRVACDTISVDAYGQRTPAVVRRFIEAADRAKFSDNPTLGLKPFTFYLTVPNRLAPKKAMKRK